MSKQGQEFTIPNLWPVNIGAQPGKNWAFHERSQTQQELTNKSLHINNRIYALRLRQIICGTDISVVAEPEYRNHFLVANFKTYVKVLNNDFLYGKRLESRALAAVQMLDMVVAFILEVKGSISNAINIKIYRQEKVNVNIQLFEKECHRYINALQDCYLPFTKEVYQSHSNQQSEYTSVRHLCLPGISSNGGIDSLPCLSKNMIESGTHMMTVFQNLNFDFVVTTKSMKIMYCWFEVLALYYETGRRFCQVYPKVISFSYNAPSNKTRHNERVHDFSIMTFNVFEHKCKYMVSALDYMENSACDIICTQEDTKNISPTKYDLLNKCGSAINGDPSYEVEAVYYLKLKRNLIKFENCVITTPPSELKLKNNYYTINRSALIFSYGNLKIANLHLDGGLAINDLFATETLEYINKLINFKYKLLIEVLKMNPDIILGDFNTVLIADNAKHDDFLSNEENKYFGSRYVKYPFENKESFKKMVRDWNFGLKYILTKNKYVYAEPENNNDFKFVVDGIWYKNNDKIYKIDTFIDALTQRKYKGRPIENPCSFSDHNPVLARVYLKK